MLLLPTTLCADIEKMLNSFWWVGQKSDSEKRYMVGIMAENVFEERSWQKEDGGLELGIR